jgi:hypothetical protein
MKPFVLTMALAACASSLAHAQSSESVAPTLPIQFDLLNPGARSLGMGGAFAAIADDATAGFTNPAGLSILGRPEISFEVRARRRETPFVAAGRANGVPSGRGEDVLSGLVPGLSIDNQFSPSFVSASFGKGRFAFSGYWHQLSKSGDRASQRGLFLTELFSDGSGSGGLFPLDLRMRGSLFERTLSIGTAGGSMSFRVTNSLSVGGGITVSRLKLHSSIGVFPYLDVPVFFGLEDYSQTLPGVIESADDVATGFLVGVQQSLGRRARVGAVYRRNPDFTFVSSNRFNSKTGDRDISLSGRFQPPDALAIGGSFRVNNELVIVSEYGYVRHSSLYDDYITLNTYVSANVESYGRVFEVDDAHEVHLGGEYSLILFGKPLALRGGSWLDPDHTVRYTGGTPRPGPFPYPAFHPAFLANAPKGKDQWHGSFGAGYSWNQHFEMNVGADFSRQSRTISSSVLTRF